MTSRRTGHFSQAVCDRIALRSGFRCAKPGCRVLTVGPALAGDQSLSIGVAAHISAASPGGARYRPDLTPAQTHAATNGIWLCQTHAKEIDNDPNVYSEALLRHWKAAAEQLAALEFNRPELERGDSVVLRFERDRTALYNAPGGRYESKLSLKALNRTHRPIDQYYFEVRIPKGLIAHPETFADYRAERSVGDYDLFVRQGDPRSALLPDDERVIFSALIGNNLVVRPGLSITGRIVPFNGNASVTSFSWLPGNA
jgi:hypothetical protein